MFRALITALALFAPALAQAYEPYNPPVDTTVVVVLSSAELNEVEERFRDGYRSDAFGNEEVMHAPRYSEILHEWATFSAKFICLVRSGADHKEATSSWELTNKFSPTIKSVSGNGSNMVFLFDCGPPKNS